MFRAPSLRVKPLLGWLVPVVLASPLGAQLSVLPIPGSPINTLAGVASIGQDQVGAYQQAAQQYLKDKTPFQWGNLNFSPHVAYAWNAATGVLAAPGQPTTTTSQSFAAGLLLQDSRWTFDYTAAWTWNSSAALKDSLSQQARFAGAETFGFLAVGFAQGYSTSSAPLISTGEATPIQSYVTTVTISSRTRSPQWLDLALSQDLQRSSSSPNLSTWTAADWLVLPISEKVSAGLGPSAGYTLESPGVDLINFDQQVRISWALTTKLNFAVQGGEESEELLSKPRSRVSTLVFNGSSLYQVTAATAVSFSASRNVEPSPLGGDLSRTTSADLSVSQQILTHFNLTARVTRGDTAYLATSLGLPVVRHDQVTSGQLGVGAVILRRISVSATYGLTRDASDASAFGFLSRRFGFDLGISY